MSSQKKMSPQDEELLGLNDIVVWFDVASYMARAWRVGRQGRTPALRQIADAMGVELPEGLKTPRSVVQVFGKAVGFLTPDGEVISAEDRAHQSDRTQPSKGKPRRWTPKKPTVDPVPGPDGNARMRFYVPHLLEEYEISRNKLQVGWQHRDKEFPPGHLDELSRRFWYASELDQWQEILRRRDLERDAGPPPDGHDEEGRPYHYIKQAHDPADGVDASGRAYRLLPPDSYWAQQTARGERGEAGEGAGATGS